MSGRLLFEMLTLSGVQVGADWTSILKKRHVYRFGTAAAPTVDVNRCFYIPETFELIS